MYAHEFPEKAGSINTKESIHIRTDEGNKEGRTGKWRAGEGSSGDIRMMTNVQEVLDEVQKIGSMAKKRTVDIFKRGFAQRRSIQENNERHGERA